MDLDNTETNETVLRVFICKEPISHDGRCNHYFLNYENRYPVGFRLVQKAKVVNGLKKKEAVWLVQGGFPSEANRPFYGDLLLTLRNTVWWATVDEYKVTRNFDHMDLSEANLSGANLGGSSLFQANLRGANLSSADLRGTSLSEANLSGANLSRADLTRANLSKANLSGVNLNGADLWLADVSGANLSGSQTNHTTQCPNGQMGPCW